MPHLFLVMTLAMNILELYSKLAHGQVAET